MKKRFIAAALATSLFAVTALPASAASPKHALPGTPGAGNCTGQTTAYLAQGGQALGAPGIGNLAELAGLSVQEVKAVVEAYCAAP